MGLPLGASSSFMREQIVEDGLSLVLGHSLDIRH
jgi:hypothetical protein